VAQAQVAFPLCASAAGPLAGRLGTERCLKSSAATAPALASQEAAGAENPHPLLQAV